MTCDTIEKVVRDLGVLLLELGSEARWTQVREARVGGLPSSLGVWAPRSRF